MEGKLDFTMVLRLAEEADTAFRESYQAFLIAKAALDAACDPSGDIKNGVTPGEWDRLYDEYEAAVRTERKTRNARYSALWRLGEAYIEKEE